MKIRVGFMGTPDFSVPTLRKLFDDENIELVFVVTKEDKRAGRGNEIAESCIKKETKELCQKNGIEFVEDFCESDNVKNEGIYIMTPHKIREDRNVIEMMKSLKPDFVVVVAYGQILSKEILDIPKKACINGHASLLPKYRGSSPIQSSILNGDKETGTTSMLMSEGLDEGDILMTKKINIEDDDTGESLFEKLSFLTADAIVETIKNFNNITPIKQDSEKATYVSKINKEDGLIDVENDTMDMVDRKVRAYYPWPSSFIKENEKIIKIFRIKKFENIDNQNIDVSLCGGFKKYLLEDGEHLLLKVKDGFVEVLELQKEGKKRMGEKEYMNGMK